MTDDASTPFDIERVLAAMRPPDYPDETFVSSNKNVYRLRDWKRPFVASMLAGLLTEPDFHANEIRLDWLLRLVLTHSAGKRKPPPKELSRALNGGLGQAKVRLQEDPNEDLFCDLVVTQYDNFRVLPGKWTNAVPSTTTLLSAFESLPPSRLKKDALTSAYSLLRVSDELAERASLHRDMPSGNNPGAAVRVPASEVLNRLARRVRFSDADLNRIGVPKATLTPFLLEPEHRPFISSYPPGDTPLELYPLFDTASGIVVLNPTTISLALRAVLVVAAQQGGMEEELLARMLVEQQAYSDATGFWPMPRLELSPPNPFALRTAVCEYEQGRFVHVIQVPAKFDHFPQRGFASVRELGKEAAEFIAADVSPFWHFLEEQRGNRGSATVLLLSSWGTPHWVAPPISHNEAPAGWHFVTLSFADAAVLGACQNGGLRHILRILEQVAHLERAGFSIQNVSGLVNLFGFWRMTDGNLIPEHLRELALPCNVAMPTDALLEPKVDAARKRDLRMLLRPDGTGKVVQRMEWGDIENLRPIYASLEDVIKGCLLGAVLMENRVWWIEADAQNFKSREWCWRVWHAVLQWLDAVGSSICARFPETYLVASVSVSLSIPETSAFRTINPPAADNTDLARSVVCLCAGDAYRPIVEIRPDWLGYLGNAENDAEVELVAPVLGQLATDGSVTRDQLRAAVQESIGSTDWRWLHSHKALTPLDRMAGSGLVARFRDIPLSAVALAKCGSVWGFRPEPEPHEIRGIDECKNFLAAYREHMLDQLIAEMKNFNREILILKAVASYQAVRPEQTHWRRTIRALRAIHGRTADASALKRWNAINVVSRAAKAVSEIGACEALEAGGHDPSPTDLDDMFAKALLIMGNSQLFALIRGGLIEPELQISPAGDLLGDRSIVETTLKPAAEWANTRALDEAAAAYVEAERTPDEASSHAIPWNEDLRRVIEAEYGVSPESLTTFSLY